MEYFSTKEIAIKLQVNEETVRRWIRVGKMKAEDLGKGVGYKVSSLDLDKFTYHNKTKHKDSSEQQSPTQGSDISVSNLHISVPLVGGVVARGLVSEIIQDRINKGIADNSDQINIQIKKYELEKRKIEIEALINSLKAEHSLIEHELKTAIEISAEKRI